MFGVLSNQPLLARRKQREPQAMRRLVLHLDLTGAALSIAPLPLGFGWSAWQDDRATSHAAVLYEGFRGGIDAGFLTALSTLEGCADLITATRHNECFLPEASWMAVRRGPSSEELPVSTIQVLGSQSRAARIQNLAVLPEYRGRGIARATLMRCLRSCRALGYELIELEVTALNTPAVELYRSLGFTLRRAYLQPVGSAAVSR